MPAPSDFGDGATVIEGATPSHAHAHAHGAHVPLGGPGSSSSGRGGKGVETFSPAKTSSGSGYYRDSTTFAKTADYFAEERPFVVLVGKNGVIGALRELDEHLRKVRNELFIIIILYSPLASLLHVRLSLTTVSFVCVCVCWLQTGHNKIISDKVCVGL